MMSGRFTILQISDLHRDPHNPIRNDALLTSLENDRQRYNRDDPPIPSPDIIVVSGDVIQGAPPGTDRFEEILAAQHEEALQFLSALADRFVGGRRDRVVIVPGNHDVSACHAMQSFKAIDIAPDRRKDLVSLLFNADSPMRWSWPDFGLFEIADAARYDERMAPFAAFYRKFYSGSRHFDLDPSKQFDIFDFPEFDLTIVGFSSCHTNDILNKQGSIHPGCIGTAASILRGPEFAGRLRLAVWHHNTEGLPMQTDYMNAGVLQNLIDCGFSLGLHGHQHKPQFLDTRFRYGSDVRITVISAGTLCGSSSYRFGRAYNVIELDIPSCSGRLHVREMQNDDLQLPIWGRRALPPIVATRFEFGFSPPPAPLVALHEPTSALIEAQRLMQHGALDEAARLLLPMADRDDLARRLLLDCLGRLHGSAAIAALYDPPRTETEALYVMDALWAENRHDRLRALLAEPLVAESSDGAVIELKDKYAARLK
jgi:hypothetical protein